MVKAFDLAEMDVLHRKVGVQRCSEREGSFTHVLHRECGFHRSFALWLGLRTIITNSPSSLHSHSTTMGNESDPVDSFKVMVPLLLGGLRGTKDQRCFGFGRGGQLPQRGPCEAMLGQRPQIGELWEDDGDASAAGRTRKRDRREQLSQQQ